MAKKRRLLIATDGKNWFVRRVAATRLDGDNNEMIYTCDRPIGRAFKSLSAAVRKAKETLSNPKSRAWR